MTSVRTKALGAVLVVLAAWSTCAQAPQEWPTYRAADVREGDIHGWFWVELPRNQRQ